MASRLLNLEVANIATQSVATGSLVNLGTIVRKYCCKDSRGIPAISFANGGQAVTLNQCGYYDVSFDITFTGEAGTASLALVANGIQVPYATTSATIGTATTEIHSSSLSAIVRILPNAPVTNLKAVKIV